MAVDANAALDRRMMRMALRLARQGRPSPNPHVGAVVAQGAEVVATGFHAKAGEEHAEAAALRQAEGKAAGATLYVSFEPCNHQGRTGPCTELIIKAGVKRVVVGCRDPVPHVPGALERLEQSGIAVEVGPYVEASRRLVADFHKHHTQGLSYVTLKAGVTLDGHLATKDNFSKWITGPRARTMAHRLRAEADAVLTGIETVLHDDPELSVRHVDGVQPLRVILDSRLRLSPSARVLQNQAQQATLIFHAADADQAKRQLLRERQIELIEVERTREGLSLPAVLKVLGQKGVVRLLVEGGAKVHGAFVQANLADRLVLFVAPRLLGTASGKPFLDIATPRKLDQTWNLQFHRLRRLGPDLVIEADFLHV